MVSRRGYAEARVYNMKGFYYFTPRDSDTWRFFNFGCMYIYFPLNMIDRGLGTGKFPAGEPMWGFST
jgi:hypothetical protein